MAALSPFLTFPKAIEAATDIWFNKVDVNGWLEAFSAHPQIGQTRAPTHTSQTSAQWSKGEQSTAMATATSTTLQELTEWNARYKQKFGFVFLICASGRSTGEILEELKRRYPNRPIVELEIAAQEQMKITELRLAKLVSEKSSATQHQPTNAMAKAEVNSSAATITANVNSIPVLNDTNFKAWKENIEIVLGCMDLDLALRKDKPPSPTAESSAADKLEHEKWERSNRMSLMMIKRSIPETFRGAMSNEENAKKFLEDIEKRFKKNEKAETSTLLANLVSLKYKGNGNIREYIMEMSNLASKLKPLKLDLSEDLLVHLVLISLPSDYKTFKVSYNTQKEKWTLNELISHCVQEEDRIKREKTESAHLASTSKGMKRKRTEGNKSVAKVSQPMLHKKQDKAITCFFCKKEGHVKKDCTKYAAWRVKKGLPVEPTAK